MATIPCNSETGLLHFPVDSVNSSPETSLTNASINSIDLIKGISDCRRKLARSLFVERILEVSFSKEGRRFYKVQWESTWESEDDLVSACKDILRTYWDNHIQFNIILDKAGYPKETANVIKVDPIPVPDTNVQDEDKSETPNMSSQVITVEPFFSSVESNEKNSVEEEPKMKDIPDQYKNVGFAKSVRENFAKELPCENSFDFVEHYLAEKSVSKSRNGIKKKARDETVRELVSYKNGTRVTCDTCCESFADAKSLKSHKICTHDLYSPHQCHICLKMFMKPGDVRRHMATHSPTRSHYCYFCEKTYKTKNHLHRHIKAKHPNYNVSDNDIFDQMLSGSDTVPTDIHQSVINMTEDEANDILTAETLNNSFNPNNNALNSFGPLTATTILFQDTLRQTGVLQQPDLSETFLNPTAEPMQLCLIDKTENFFTCPQFVTADTLVQT